MILPLTVVAGLCCAQFDAMELPGVEDVPPPRAASSRVVAVTVYQGEALVTREVAIPEGPGPVELVITPLPESAMPGSLHAEGGMAFAS